MRIWREGLRNITVPRRHPGGTYRHGGDVYGLDAHLAHEAEQLGWTRVNPGDGGPLTHGQGQLHGHEHFPVLAAH